MNTAISGMKTKIYFPGNAGNVAKTQEMQNKDSFSVIFDKTQGTEGNFAKEEPVKAEKTEFNSEGNVKAEETENVKNHADIQTNKASGAIKEQTEEMKITEATQEVEDAIYEAAGMIVQNIAEVFDVTVEEVEKVLETLGFAAMDLLNSENLTKVVLALNPNYDAMELMTNEELFADFKGLMNVVQEVKEQIVQDFNLTEEELALVVKVLKNEQQLQETVDVEMAETEETQLTEVAVQAATEKLNVQFDVAEVTDVSNKEVQSYDELKVETKTETAKPQEQVEIEKEVKVTGMESEKSLQKDATDSKGDFSNTAGQNFSQNVVNQLAEAVENANSSTASYGVRGQDIINQITEQIRIHVTRETTEMELQLHPASLGNVKVQIASTGGVLTAVFTTENEAVKAALESQLVQLKENFTEQGLKVESVEVNVSAQGFERSLDQQEQEQNRFANNQNKKGNRRIRLQGTEEAGDLLTEDISGDDRIVADMMIRNGNTVDYMV